MTSFSKSEINKNLEDVLPMGAYNKYKKITNHPIGYNGNTCIMFKSQVLLKCVLCRSSVEKQSEICEDLL